MSPRSERDDDANQSLRDAAEDWYHVPVLVVAMVAMFAVRMQGYSRFVRGGEVFFSGNDAWYHLREVNYTVRHFPFTMPFDPWTNYPTGTFVGQFGTLYDQLIAFVALVVGLGSPSETLVAKTLLVAPPVFGALAVIPVYFIGKRLGGRIGGLFGVLVLALLPGTFLQRTLVGAADHNAAEPFFMGLAVAGLLGAFAVAERTMPVWEVVEEEFIQQRSVNTLREPLVRSLVGGFLTGLFLLVWPPAIFLVGIVGLFVVLKLTNDVVHGNTPEPVAFAAAVSMGVVALMSLLFLDTFGFDTTTLSLLQPITALTVAGGAVFLSWLARLWEREGYDENLYPAAILGIGVVGVLFAAVALGSVFDLVTNNLLRIVGFSAGAATRTIGEAQPFLDPGSLQRIGVDRTGRILLEYGLTFFTAVVAATWLHARPLLRDGEARDYGYVVGSMLVVVFIFAAPGVLAWIGNLFSVNGQVVGLFVVGALIAGALMLAEYDAVDLFVIVWAAFITSMAFTQVRFNYYLAVVVAVLNAFLFAQVLGLFGFAAPAREAFADVEFYQVAVVVAVVLLVLAPVLAFPIAIGSANQQVNTSTATATANQSAHPGSVLAWEGTFDWMQNNTPAEGNFGGAGNADQMKYYGKYERTADHSYPKGSYGVMSWWDYGHWITVQGKRIPNANPFQQGAKNAANFLLAPNESQAQAVLQKGSEKGETTRYVMVDWQMASTQSKFGAPIVFYDAQDVSSRDFYTNMYVQTQGGVFAYGQIYEQRYYESMMTRLYRYHGSARDPAPIVTDWDRGKFQNSRTGESVTLPVRPRDNSSMIKTFNNMSAARAYVQNDSTSKIGGVGPFPNERVEALQHYRLVKMSESQTRSYFANEMRQAQLAGNPIYQYFLSQTTPAWVKTFERVPGATVQGSGAPPNTEVKATVQMKDPATNTTFTYTQYAQTDANGNFKMVLPYSTTGYDRFGPENGYTNVSVRANSSYTVTAPARTADNGSTVQAGATFDVSEAKVLGVNESVKQVTLTEKVKQPEGANATNNTTTGNSTNSSALTGQAWAPADGGSSATDDGQADWTDASTRGDDAGRARPSLQIARPATVAVLG